MGCHGRCYISARRCDALRVMRLAPRTRSAQIPRAISRPASCRLEDAHGVRFLCATLNVERSTFNLTPAECVHAASCLAFVRVRPAGTAQCRRWKARRPRWRATVRQPVGWPLL